MYTLGGLTFTYNPSRETGVPLPKSRVDVQTLGGNVSQVFGFFDEDRFIEYDWDLMPIADYNALEALHIAGDGAATYTLDPEDGHTYDVEIVALEGVLYLNLPATHRKNVRLTLKVLEVLS